MNKLFLMALVCLGLGAEVLACGCGAARPTVPSKSNNNSSTVTHK